jgi:hypothetical protein
MIQIQPLKYCIKFIDPLYTHLYYIGRRHFSYYRINCEKDITGHFDIFTENKFNCENQKLFITMLLFDCLVSHVGERKK